MYNKSIKLRPYEPLPTPDAKSNKDPSAPQVKKTKKKKSKKKKKRAQTLKAAPTLGRLPSSIPDPPPDIDEDESSLVLRTSGGADISKLIYSSRPVSGSRPISSAIEATETFRFSSESSEVRPESVVKAGLAPPAPPPPPFSAIPHYNLSPESFSRDRHSNASSKIVVTETFALSDGERTSDSTASTTRSRGASCVTAGLAPVAPLPPMTEEAEVEQIEEAEIEEGNTMEEAEVQEDDWEEDESTEEEDEIVEIVPERVRADTMSRAMKTAIRREMRTGSMAGAPQKQTIHDLLHQKDHSRFSILRYSTDTMYSDHDDEEGEEASYDNYQDESDLFESPTPDTADPFTFINQFMYEVTEVEAPMEPKEVYREVAKSVVSDRSRTISVVKSAPRALSVIHKEEQNIMKEQEYEKKRRDSAKKLDEFLSSTRPMSKSMETGRISSSSSASTSGSSKRASVSNFVRNLASTPAIITLSKDNDVTREKHKSRDRPKMRERDLSDNQFYHVYAMTRQQFSQLSILKRAWLRQENKHRRPYVEDIEI